MPAKGIFTLGVGHVRRKTIEPGSRAESPAKMIEVRAVELSEREWKVLLALKREFAPEEIRPTPWASRANESGVSLEEFYCVAEELNARKIIGRFSTFLEHVKPSAGGVRVTRFNALFHWAVRPGREIEAGSDLSAFDVQEAAAFLLSDSIEAKTKADFLTVLHDKGESAHEIASFVRVLLERAVPLEIEEIGGPIIDVCGTGGDGIDLFNVSTAVTFVLAAGGATVVKHGNRGVTSRSGSADVLEALGVEIDLEPDDLRECIKRVGCGFVFARTYHPAFRVLAEMRQQLARRHQRTIFNLLGPLLNPARPKRQLIGVFSPHRRCCSP